MLCDRVVVGPVADDDDDGVVARNGSEYLRYLAVVDVEGDTAGISGLVRMTPMFPENLMLRNPVLLMLSSVEFSGVCTRLYIVSFGNTYTYWPPIVAALATLSCLRSRLSVACVRK